MAETVRSFCRVCIAGCGTLVTVDGDRVLDVSGDPDHPLSAGYLCPKGRALRELHHDPARLDTSLVRRDGQLVEVDTETALAGAASALAEMADAHGADTVGFFLGSGGFIDPAAAYVARKFRMALGTDQNYSNATVDAIAKVVTTSLMAGTMALVPHVDPVARLVVFVGSNPVVSHGQSTGFPNPIERLRHWRRQGRVVVVDPRRTETARQADHHLAPRPGTDHVLLGHLVREVVRRRGLDAASLPAPTVGFESLVEAVEPLTAERAATVTGIEPDDLAGLVDAIEQAGRLAVVTGTGTSMSVDGNLVEWMAWSLMILTDSFDRPGGMWFNPGYLTRLDQRPQLPPVPPDLPSSPTLPTQVNASAEWPASSIPHEIEAGRLRALVVVGANLVTALPQTDRLAAALDRLDALVVLDLFANETAAHASHVFACVDQLERPDVVPLDLYVPARATQLTRTVVEPPPGRVPAWRVLTELAWRMGHDLLGDPADLTPEAVLGRVARGVDLDELSDHDGAMVVEDAAVHGWAVDRLPAGHWDLAPRPLVDQLAAFVEGISRPGAALVLTPRRQLRRENARAYRPGEVAEVWLHPTDAAIRGITDGAEVEVRSASGHLRLPARVTERVRPGAASIPHGYGDLNVNRLVSCADLDPLSGMPRMSGTEVEVESVAVAPGPPADQASRGTISA